MRKTIEMQLQEAYKKQKKLKVEKDRIQAQIKENNILIKSLLKKGRKEKGEEVLKKIEAGGKSSNMYMIMDRSRKGVFWCNPIIFSLSFSPKAKLVYLYFCRCSNKEGSCYPGHKSIADMCSASVSTVRYAIKELVENGIIEIRKRARENNGQTSNLYTIISFVCSAVKSFSERKKEKNMCSQKPVHNDKKTVEKQSKGFIACIKTYIDRGHRHILTRGLSIYGDERTITNIRTIHY